MKIVEENIARPSEIVKAFEFSPMGMFLVSANGIIEKTNRKSSEILGFSEKELEGKSVDDITYPEDRHIARDYMAAAILGKKKGLTAEKRYVHKTGRIVWAKVSTFLVAEGDEVKCFIVQVQDISKERESNVKFQNLLENSLVGIYIHQDGYFKYVNSRMSEIMGYSEEELLSTPSKEFLHEEDMPIAVEMMRKRLEGEVESIQYELRVKTKDGSFVWVEVLGSTITHEGETAVMGNLRDLSSQKNSEAQLKKINHDIGKRIRELNCLYQLSQLKNKNEKEISNILSEFVHLIPPSYQYPEITTARLTYYNEVYTSNKFKESIWAQNEDIFEDKEKIGSVEVFYNEERPELDEGPFLKEERILIQSIATMLGSAIAKKNVLREIKEQKEKFQAIIENTKEAIYLISPGFKLLMFNKIANQRNNQVNGYDLFEGQDFNDLMNPSTRGVFTRMFNDALKGKYVTKELKSQGRVGDSYWMRVKIFPVYKPDGQLMGVCLLSENIDDSKKSELELRESEEKFRSLVEQNLIGVYIVSNGQIAYVNPGLEKISGYTKEELLGMPEFLELVHPEERERIRSIHKARINREGAPSQYTFRALRKDGSVRHIDVIANITTYNFQPAVIGSMIDITDRVLEENRINEAVILAQEKERYQIGMELHDNVQQILVGTGMFLEIASKRTNDANYLEKTLSSLMQYNKEAIQELRMLSHQLAPVMNSDSPLIEKIDILLSRYGIVDQLNVETKIDNFNVPLSEAVQLVVYRIIQEQLSNIIKYANATELKVKVGSLNETLKLTIEDNGVGFDMNQKFNGIGFENMRRRAQALGGQLEIDASPGNGCRLSIEVPLT